MKITFCDTNILVCKALVDERNKASEKIQSIVGPIRHDDILSFKNETFDAIISPANSRGDMSGGIDLAYRNFFGRCIEEELKKEIGYGILPVGRAVGIKTGSHRIGYMISAPTMTIPMDVSNTRNAYLAMKASIHEVETWNRVLRDIDDDMIETILCPGLCTLTGRMLPEESAKQIFEALTECFN